jgi:hypothetical protein
MVYIPEPGESRRERHLAFIAANAADLAQAARIGYQNHGRGMLMLDATDFVDKPRGVLARYRRAYVAEGTSEYELLGGTWPGDKEAMWVEGYNPETTMLIAVAKTDGGVSSYRVRFKVPGPIN